jgi:excisionase family DNA binding protein
MQKLTEYMKIAEAACILGCSQTTLRAWADAGHVPACRNPANGYRLFRRDDLDDFLRQVAEMNSPPRKPK